MSTISASDARPGFIPTTNSGSQGRPLKIRHACTQCHAIKIRCTGEKTGCARCHNLRLECEYTVSMVGRMSTKRNHRWNSAKNNPRNISSATSQASSSEPSETTSILQPPSQHNSNSILGPDFNVCSDSDDFGMDYFSELFDATVLPTNTEPKDPSKAMPLSNDPLPTLPLTMASDSNFPSLTVQDQASMDDLLPVFHDADGMSSQAPSVMSLGAISMAPAKNPPLSIQSLDPSLQNIHNNSEVLSRFPYLLPIINTIATTEAHLQRANIPIDEAMCTNKACMFQISATMENEEFIKCNSCSLLVATAMQMVIMLYEKALFPTDHGNSVSVMDNSEVCNRMMLAGLSYSGKVDTANTISSSNTSNNDQQSIVSSPSGTSGPSKMPILQFGIFQFEPEEPICFRNQIIRKELQRCIQILRACQSDDRQSKRQSATGRSSPGLLAGDKVRKTWLLEMERRANTLIASLSVGRAADTETDVEKDRARQRDRGRKRSIENALLC